jgi:hypothetical protein
MPPRANDTFRRHASTFTSAKSFHPGRWEELGWVYYNVSLLAYQLSSRHILSVPAEQLMRSNKLGLAVSIPGLVAGLAAADDLGQLCGGGLVEFLGCL